jgi:hypothetical protein
LSRDAWRRVAAAFVPRARNAQTERRQIAHGVALIQLLVGQQTGTAVHQWTHRDKEIVPNLNDPTQLDCIDEAVNTWTYLTLMERGGLFHFHRVAKLSHAGTLIDPRNTAVLKEIGGQYFAIDPALVAASDYSARNLAWSLATKPSCERGARTFEYGRAQISAAGSRQISPSCRSCWQSCVERV